MANCQASLAQRPMQKVLKQLAKKMCPQRQNQRGSLQRDSSRCHGMMLASCLDLGKNRFFHHKLFVGLLAGFSSCWGGKMMEKLVLSGVGPGQQHCENTTTQLQRCYLCVACVLQMGGRPFACNLGRFLGVSAGRSGRVPLGVRVLVCCIQIRSWRRRDFLAQAFVLGCLFSGRCLQENTSLANTANVFRAFRVPHHTTHKNRIMS